MNVRLLGAVALLNYVYLGWVNYELQRHFPSLQISTLTSKNIYWPFTLLLFSYLQVSIANKFLFSLLGIMMGLREIMKDLARYPSRLLGEIIGDDLSVTSTGYEKLEIKESNEAQRKDQRIWNSTGKGTLSGIFPPQKRGRERKCHICSFDEGILAKIIANLGLVDQICFALTCKILIAKYRRIIKNSATNPRQPSMCYLPLSFVNSDDQLRVKLLTKLENSRWAYCAKCFVLKLRRMFEPDAMVALPLQRNCTRHHRVIELCPCLHFTCRDRENVRIFSGRPSRSLRSEVTVMGFSRLPSRRLRPIMAVSDLILTDGQVKVISARSTQAQIDG